MYATRQPAPTPVIITAACQDNDIIRNVRYAHTLEVGDVVALMTHTDPYGFWLARVTTAFYRKRDKGLIDIQWYERYRLQLFKPLQTQQPISVDCLVVVPLKVIGEYKHARSTTRRPPRRVPYVYRLTVLHTVFLKWFGDTRVVGVERG
jgi:hypothetical protein